MTKKIIILLLLLSFILSGSIRVDASFPYALQEEDLPPGFTLYETTHSSETNISQFWKTPQSQNSTTALWTINYLTKEILDREWANLTNDEYNNSDVNFQGADAGLNKSFVEGLNIYLAKTGTFMTYSLASSNDITDVRILIEAQITKIITNDTVETISNFRLDQFFNTIMTLALVSVVGSSTGAVVAYLLKRRRKIT